MGRIGYAFTRYLIKVVLSLFFRSIEVVGREEHVPATGPVIFAATHPNTLLDPCLLIATAPRPARFMAKDTLWGNYLVRPFLNMTSSVPVARRQDHGAMTDAERAAAVEETFAALYATLEDGACIGIFPEGISHTDSQLAPLRSGMARIALGYVAAGRAPAAVPARRPESYTESDALTPTARAWALPAGGGGGGGGRSITIVPCGLTYLSRSSFRSRVLVEYGQPIVVGRDRVDAFVADSKAAVKTLTDEVAGALDGLTLSAPDWTTVRLVQMAKNAVQARGGTMADHVASSKAFMNKYLEVAHEPDMVLLTADGVDYLERLDRLWLKDHHIASNVGVSMALFGLLGRFILFAVLLPFAALGFALHLPAYVLAYVATRQLSADSLDTIGTVKAILLTFCVPTLYLAYTLAATIIHPFFAWYVWLGLCIVGLPCLGFATSHAIIYGRKVLIGMCAIVTLVHWRAEVAQLRIFRASLYGRVVAAIARYSDTGAPPDAAAARSSSRLPTILGFGASPVINV